MDCSQTKKMKSLQNIMIQGSNQSSMQQGNKIQCPQTIDQNSLKNQAPINKEQNISPSLIKNQDVEIQTVKINQNKTQQKLGTNQNETKKNQILKIFQKYGVDQEETQSAWESFLQGKIDDCVQFVKSKYRGQMKAEIVQFLNKQNKKLEVPEKQEESQQNKFENFILEILKKYKVDEEDFQDAKKQINGGNIEQFVKYAKKNVRDNMKKQVQQFLKGKGTKNIQSQLEKEIICILQQFDIEEEHSVCIKSIKEGDLDSVIDQVKKNKRNQLRKSLETLLKKYEKIIPNKIAVKKQFALKIKIGDKIFQHFIQNGEEQLTKILLEQYDIENMDQYRILFQNKPIQSITQIFNTDKSKGLLKIIKKIQNYYEYKGELTNFWISDMADIRQIKMEIIKKLRENNQYHEDQNKIFLKFIHQRETVQNFENLRKSQLIYGKLQKVIVEKQIEVTIYYQSTEKIYKLRSLSTILDLKKLIQEEKDSIPRQAQSLSYQLQSNKITIKQRQDDQLITKIITKKENYFEFDLCNAFTTEYYGFHDNINQNYSKFSEFIIQDESQLIEVIKNCNFNQKNQDRIFFDNFIIFLYSCIKKRFPIQTVIEKVRQLVVKNKFQNIWVPLEKGKQRKMNQTFVLMYLLRNSDMRLKIQIMDLVKNLMPLPMFISNFSSIFDFNSEMVFNQQIIWILKKGMTICSFGLHTQDYEKQRGKSFFLNEIFFTNFCLAESKNKLVEKIPFIAIRVFQDLFPLNIIDIPHDLDPQISMILLEKSDIIIMHSWKSENETTIQMNNIEKKYGSKIISIIRDNKQQSRDNLKTLNEIDLKVKNILKISNITNTEDNKGTIDILRQKINLYLLDLKSQLIKSKKVFEIIQNQQFEKLNIIFDNFQKNNIQTCQFLKYTTLFDKEKTESQQNIVEDLKHKKLNEQILKTLQFAKNSTIPKDIMLMYFRQKLRSIQNENVSKYMIIYKIKERLLKSDENNQTQYNHQLQEAEKKMKQLTLLYHKDRSFLNKKPDEVKKIIDFITSDFQNKLKPKFFSIQLFWREIYAFLKFQPNYKIGQMNLFDLVVELKSKQIMNNQPFQIIDGDCLEMPKDIMKRVFANIPDNCLVLTIIGPQSSGKSTLLNFLFGCDFATSEGRCTRGVYGTYFRLKDIRYNFQGIFVIDTQGLFALTNQSDENFQDRQNFDAKLVLFCLAVSDFVIINVRGNIDINTQKILSICHQKLESLNLNQLNKPQIIIILNQNSTSKTEQSQNEFKKIRKTLQFHLCRSLSQAYSIKNYGKNQICLLTENQILTKKIPYSQFRNQTSNLLSQLAKRMKKRKTSQKITIKIDKFAQIWSTVLSFPNLSQNTTKQYRILEQKIKEWKKIKDQQFNLKFRQIITLFKNEQLNQDEASNQLNEQNLKYLEDFQHQYQNTATNQQLKILVQNQRKQLLLKNQNNILKLKYSVMQLNLEKQIIKEKFQGDSLLREQEKIIIKNQNVNNKVYTKQQKQEIFNKFFNLALDKIKKTMKISVKCQCQFDKIKSQYELIIKTSSSQLKSYGLPKHFSNITANQVINNDYQVIKNKLIDRLQTIDQAENFMFFTQRPYTNVLKGSPSDAKLQYFNILDYFKKQQKKRYFTININSLCDHFNLQKFFNIFDTQRNQLKEQFGEIQRLKDIFQNINKYLRTYFSIQIQSFLNFKKVYQEQTCNFISKTFNYITSQNNSIRIKKYYKSQWSTHQFSCMGCQHDKETIFLKFERNEIATKRIITQSNYETGKNQKNTNNQPVSIQIWELKITNHVQKKIKDKIDWKLISTYLKDKQKNRNSVQKQNARNIINNRLSDILNEDLNKINLHLCKQINFFHIFENKNPFQNHRKYPYSDQHQKTKNYYNYEIFKEVRVIDEQLIAKDQSQFLMQFNNLVYFNGRKIQQQLKNNPNQYDLKIATYIYEVFTTSNEQFIGYQQSNKQVKRRFQQKRFKDFIFNEIKYKKKSMSKFFIQISKIVEQIHKKWGQFDNNKAIPEVYNLINEQISKFNNDLNQISHELLPVIVGQIHLLVINLIWKLIIDGILKKQNQPYQKKFESRQAELQKFLKRTSNEIDSIIQQEVQTFLEEIQIHYSKFIEIQKQDLFYDKRIEFNDNTKRKDIQKQIDLQMFSHKDNQKILDYIQKPYQFIQKKYEQNYEQKWEQIKQWFNKKKYFQTFIKQFENFFVQTKETLQNVDKITQDKGNPRDLMEMVTKQSKQVDYDEQAKKILFEYFLDKLLHNAEQKERDCLDIVLKSRNSLTKIRKPQGLLLQILNKLNGENLKMTNLPKFLFFLLKESIFSQFKKRLQKITQLNEYSQKKNFINQIRVVICKQKCPCCARICGIQESHSFHKCLYGHQMRALAGNFVLRSGKKQAFVVRCQMLKDTDLMQYNGNPFTWIKFKQYWSKKPTGGWLYDDLKDPLSQNDRKRFENAWLKAGPQYCKKNGIQYVDYNDAEKQINHTNHFIFALDQSSSMSRSWDDLIKALEKIMIKIQQLRKKMGQIYVSIFNFADNTRIIYERKNPSIINVKNINIEGGGTDFQKAFQTAYNLSSKYINNERIIFIFMTDGGATYPSYGILNLQSLMEKYSKMFIYSGIQFGSNQDVMKLISTALKGTNLMAGSFQDLLAAYSSCIEIIAYKES